MRKGFTLVELAIVLVIIGLLVGGVLSGQELIHQASIRSVLTQIRSYNTAVTTFKTKFGPTALPGDFTKANAFGIDRNAAGTQNVALTANSNYNGDGDGQLDGETDNHNVFAGEIANFWVHLANLNLIKGGFTQTLGCNGTGVDECDDTHGSGFPDASVGTGILVANTGEAMTGALVSPLWFLVGVGSSRVNNMGAYIANSQNTAGGNNLTPEDAYAVDSKLDDGLAGSGRVVTFSGLGCSGCSTATVPFFRITGNASRCNSASDTYNVNLTSNLCTIAIRTEF